MSKNLLKLAYNDDFSYDYEELKSYKKPRKTIPKENFEETKRKAIQKAIDIAKDNDMVLILGKGNETYEKLKNETIYFNDIEEAYNAVATRKIKEGTTN